MYQTLFETFVHATITWSILGSK